jgi:DNA-directed RNA polymerase subunit RPC12/RpoP
VDWGLYSNPTPKSGKPVDMIFCTRCGKEATPDDIHCAACGLKLAQPLSSTSASADSDQTGYVQVNQPLRRAINFFSPKCPHCGTKGEIKYIGWKRTNEEHGYGIVTRTQTESRVRKGTDGNGITEDVTVERQERAPVVRRTYTRLYRCMRCTKSWTKDKTTEEEDFSPPRPLEKSTVVVTKEVMKIPCRYCGALLDPVQNSLCPRCGAKIFR